MSPDMERHLSGVFPDLQALYRGHDGVRQFVARFVATWEELIPEAVLEMGHVWTFREGLVARMDAFADPRTALEAAGLSK